VGSEDRAARRSNSHRGSEDEAPRRKGKAPLREVLATIEQIAARYQIPPQLTGRVSGIPVADTPSQDTGQVGACPARTRAIPARCGRSGYRACSPQRTGSQPVLSNQVSN